MEKALNINLAGTLFKINEKAYNVLRDYLQAIDLLFRGENGGNETIEDIESRMAEIFNSQLRPEGIITLENVESMMTIIGDPADFDQSEEEEYEPTMIKRKKLYRNPDDTIVAGICGGIGAYLNTDPTDRKSVV